MDLGFNIHELVVKDSDQLLCPQTKGFTIAWLYNGSIDVSIDESYIKIGADEIVILKPGSKITVHKTGRNKDVHILCLIVTDQLLLKLSNETTDLLSALQNAADMICKVTPLTKELMLTRNLVNYLYSICVKNEFGRDLLIANVLSVILIKVVTIFTKAGPGEPAKKESGINLDSLFLYIRSHLSETITLKNLEDFFFMSHEHIAREFKKQTGQTIHKYILNYRLEQSGLLLKEGIPAYKVWKMCGFNSYEYFTQAFKRHYGATPKNYFDIEHCDSFKNR